MAKNNGSHIEINAFPGNDNVPRVDISLTSDTIIVFGILVWFLWNKVMKPTVVDKLDGVFAPIEEERKLNGVLAQIGIITGASRVVLAAFHNGALDSEGYHLQKLSTVNTYTAPNHMPMTYPIRDLPIGRIMFEIEEMMKTPDWVVTRYSDDLPQPCKDHLLKNSIYKMANKLIRVGNLPIGILSLQYEDERHLYESVVLDQHKDLMDDLYNQISVIMRRRIVHPSPVHRIFGTLLGTIKIKRSR